MLKQKEWIDVIVEKTGVSKKDAKALYDCVFDYMREQISPEEVIKIPGFGVFKLRKTADKEQINLVTGQAEVVPAHNVVTFKPYFEIDPKPEAIEVEWDEELAEDAPAVAVEAEEVAEEAAEAPVEEEVVEEAKEEPVVEEEPVAEEKDEYVWLYNNERCSTGQIVELLKEKTNLNEADILDSINVIKDKLAKLGKNVCEIKEKDDAFDVLIVK